jgi:hypothetical protein
MSGRWNGIYVKAALLDAQVVHDISAWATNSQTAAMTTGIITPVILGSPCLYWRASQVQKYQALR